MKAIAAFGWLSAAFGVFAAIMVLATLGQQTAGDATIRFLASVALAIAGAVVAWRARRVAPRIPTGEAERYILGAARAHDGRVTANEIAAATPVPLAQATEMLEALSRRGLCRMSIAEAGILVFEFPELQKVEPEAVASSTEASAAATAAPQAQAPRAQRTSD